MSIQQSILELESKLKESAKLMNNLEQSKLMNVMRNKLNNIDEIYQQYQELDKIEFSPYDIAHVEALEYAGDMELRNEKSGVSYLKEQFKKAPIVELKERLSKSYEKLGWPKDKIEGELSYLNDQTQIDKANSSLEEETLLKKFESNVPGSLADDPELKEILSELNADIGVNKKFKASQNLEKFVIEKWHGLTDPDNPHFEAMEHYAGKMKLEFGKLAKETQITM